MQEREQILYMQIRLMNMASKRWNRTMKETANLFGQYGIAAMIEEDFDYFHAEGDEAVYFDIMQVLKSKGVDPCGRMEG